MKKIYVLLVFASVSVSAQLQWRPLTSAISNGNNQRFDDVFFLNDNLGWAANGAYAAIYKTTDGGVNWNLQIAEQTPQLPGNNYFRNVEFLDENIGFVGTLNGKFLRTTDGGTTWNLATIIPNPPAICGIDCVGTSTVYGCGAYFSSPATETSALVPSYIIKSTDSGETWQYIDMTAYAESLVEVLFEDINTGYASGKSASGGIILKTTDGGTTWTEIYNSNVPGEYVWKLQQLASNSDVIFGSVESVTPLNGKLLRSLDHGVTWTSKEVPDPDIQAVGFLTPDHGWMGGHNTGFLETTNAGDTWTPVTVNGNGVGSNLNRIFILHDNLAYASGTTVYKFSDNTLGSSQFTEKARKPLKAAVSPNPVKDKLTLTVEFPDPDHLRIELYDAAGKRIKVLQEDDISSASKKTYTFDFPFASGNYLVNLHTNTGRQSIKFVK